MSSDAVRLLKAFRMMDASGPEGETAFRSTLALLRKLGTSFGDVADILEESAANTNTPNAEQIQQMRAQLHQLLSENAQLRRVFDEHTALKERVRKADEDLLNSAEQIRNLKRQIERLERRASQGNHSASISNLLTPDDSGILFEGEGIYLGIWEPRDEHGYPLRKVFDVYAAPEDLKDKDGSNLLMTFNDAVHYVARLKKFHNQDGANFSEHIAILDAVRHNPAALKKWFIPTKEILHGHDAIWNGYNIVENKVQRANLYDRRNSDDFANTFITTAETVRTFRRGAYYTEVGFSANYWSLNMHRDVEDLRYLHNFAANRGNWMSKNDLTFSTRVVRAILRPSP